MSVHAQNLAIAVSQSSDELPTIPYKTNIFNRFNLPNRTPIKITPDMVVAEWYNHIINYDFSTSATENNPTPMDPDVWVKAHSGKPLDDIY